MRKKVAHVLWSGGFGGMTRAVFQLMCAQKELSEYEPVLIAASGDSDWFNDLRGRGVEVIDLGLHSDRQIYRAFALASSFRRFPIHHFHATEITLVFASLLARNSIRVFTNRTGYAHHEPLRRIRYGI